VCKKKREEKKKEGGPASTLLSLLLSACGILHGGSRDLKRKEEDRGEEPHALTLTLAAALYAPVPLPCPRKEGGGREKEGRAVSATRLYGMVYSAAFGGAEGGESEGKGERARRSGAFRSWSIEFNLGRGKNYRGGKRKRKR